MQRVLMRNHRCRGNLEQDYGLKLLDFRLWVKTFLDIRLTNKTNQTLLLSILVFDSKFVVQSWLNQISRVDWVAF